MSENIIVKNLILKEGCVTEEIREKFFYPKSIFEIRDWLEENKLNRHMPVALTSTDIAIITPEGLIMQVRPCDSNKIGLWGGVVNDRETPLECAIRELREETGLQVTGDRLTYVGTEQYTHQYANQDTVIYTAYQYILEFDYVPKIVTDEESSGIVITKKIEDYSTTIVGTKEFMEKYIIGIKW